MKPFDKKEKKVLSKNSSAAKKKLKSPDVQLKDINLNETVLQKKTASFPIVGIGASAGGLEALELFLKNVPEGSGMAFVIVQHQDPTHKSMLVELLQRGTSMHVFQVKDRMRVEANCVYVIPSNKDMSILHGVLHLLDPVAARGMRLPIDFFFRALAEDQQEQSIGVILSGMGSDGTLGLRAIKGKAGVVFVQEPASAKFDGMPRSAIEAGLADVIAPVEILPGKICAYFQHVPIIAKPGCLDEYTAQSALEKVVILLHEKTGHDFSLYKKATVYRRIERRMGLHQISKIANYVRFLQENPQEVELLFRELLIGVTSFFRDPEAWEQLKAEVLPALLAGRASNQTLRVWIPACATGEEAYSLAILFKERLEELKSAKNITVQIFATDLDQQAIEKAREGVFPANIADDVSAQRLDRFFVKVERGYQVARSIRETVIFAPQNIIMDPPFTKLDLMICRNLLIYLTPELQKKLFLLFHYSLNPGGFLFLGNAETVGDLTNLFAPLAGKARLYRRLASALTTERIEFPTTFIAAQPGAAARPLTPTADLQTLADQLLLQTYSPAAVLTNDKGGILYISGRTGKYLEPAAGKANWNIFAMAREGLRYELRNAFRKALRQKETVKLENISVGTNGGKQVVNVTIQPLSGPNALHGMVMIVFTDVSAMPKTKTTGKPRGDSTRTAELEQELEHARQEVQSIREEMQTPQKEFKSSNEELQSSNEELQSTNEELTTLKEELQSMNEELHMVNQELQTRLDELSRTNNDMKNLLDSTDIATLFLDNSLCVRRFTSKTSKVTKLIPSDVGRPITDIASALLYHELADDAREVLQTLIRVERQIPTPDGNWFAARILPYRTLDNMTDGIVITFIDITVSKKLEAELRATEARAREILEFAESVINTVREPLISLDQDLRVVTVSRSFYEFFKVKPEETVGQLIYDLGNKQWDIPKLRELLETILPQKTTFDNYEVEHVFSTIGRRIMLLNARQIRRASGKERIILLAIEDITERRKIENGLERTRKELEATKISEDAAREYSESIINTVREPLISLDQDLRVVSASRSFYDFFKVKPEETVGQLIYDLGNKQWDIPKLRELLETILPQKTTFDNYEVEHDFTTIGRRIMLLNARQIQRVLGKERIILLAIEDITERKWTEEALRKANDLLRLAVVVRDAHDAITVQDLDGSITAWNPGAVRMYGWSEAEALLMNVRGRIPERLREEALAKINQLSRTEILEPYRTQRITKDGTVVEISMISTALVNETGQMYAIATTERTRESKIGQTMEAHNDQQ